MQRITRILVPIDFTLRSSAALDYAIDLGSRLESRIHLLHAYRCFGADPGEHRQDIDAGADRDLRIAAQLRASAWTARVRAAGIEAELTLSPRPVWAAIAAALDATGADLLVLGSRRGLDSTRSLQGTPAAAALGRAGCALMTVKLASHPVPDEGIFARGATRPLTP